MEIFVGIYLVIGAGLAYGLKCESAFEPGRYESLVLVNPSGAVLVAVVWPIVVLRLLPKLTRISYRGKVYWKKGSSS